ncbi:MAG: hypothetical protein R3Y56_02715 [Akkermansia sp.]
MAHAAPAMVQLSQAEQEALAIEKTLILATLLQAEEHAAGSTLSTSEQNMKRCLTFAQAQGAPARFIDLLKASAQETNGEQSQLLAQHLDELLTSYHIDTTRLYIWTSICQMDAQTAEAYLSGKSGSHALRSELQAADPSMLATLPKAEVQATASTIKQSLLLLNFYNIKDNLRITDEHLEQLIAFAEDKGAPKMFTRLLRADSSRSIAPNMRYEVNKFLDALLEAYLIDRKSLRTYAEACGVSPDEMIKLITSEDSKNTFFDEYSFNLLPKISDKLSPEQVQSSSQQWLLETRHIAETLAQITPAKASGAYLQDIARCLPSYMRILSLQQRRDPALLKLMQSSCPDKIPNLMIALKVTQHELHRLLLLKDELPVPLRALLAQFM